MPLIKPGHFLYFGYGSNLLRERLRLANPSAEFVATGRLSDYRLEFADPHHYLTESAKSTGNNRQRTWHGGAATLVAASATTGGSDNSQAPPPVVYGAVWSMSDRDAESLDNQEGVQQGIYERISVTVELADGSHQCRSYRMVRFKPMPPSPYYLDVILRGAVQSGLSVDYVNALRQREHNGYTGRCEKYDEVLQLCSATLEGVPPCQVDFLKCLGR